MLQAHEVNRNTVCQLPDPESQTCHQKEHGSYCRLRKWLSLRREKKRGTGKAMEESNSQMPDLLLRGHFSSDVLQRKGQLAIPNQHPNLAQTCSCPSPKTSRAAMSQNVLCSTWPPAGRKQYQNGKFNATYANTSVEIYNHDNNIICCTAVLVSV